MAKLRSIEEFNLPQWIQDARSSYKKGTISADKIKILESIPTWVWEPYKKEAAWQKGFELTKQYGIVVKKFITPDGYKLGMWQRWTTGEFNKGNLSEERILLLKSVGYDFDPMETAWRRGFELTKQYGLVKPKFETPDGYALFNWQLNQRSANMRGQLPEERFKLLDSLPDWVWNTRDVKWNRSFELSKQYGMVARSFVAPDGYKKLGFWQNKQKGDHKRGKLSKERVKKLNTIPGWKWIQGK